MGYKKYLTTEERSTIISMKSNGDSIISIAKVIHRSRRIISEFIKNPEEYIKNIKLNGNLTKSYEILNNSFEDNDIEMKPKLTAAAEATQKKTARKIEPAVEDGLDQNNSIVSRNRFLTPEERTTILSMKHKGDSIRYISTVIHRSRKTINDFVRNPEGYLNRIHPKKPAAAVPNKKIIRKNYDSSKKKTFSEDDLKRFNRVSVEHRAVIKYLIKKGIGPRFIFEDIQKVYGSVAPDLPSILYWSKQYQQGRKTIFNEPVNKNAQNKQDSNNGGSSINVTNKISSASSKPVKLFKFKFKPIKRLQE